MKVPAPDRLLTPPHFVWRSRRQRLRLLLLLGLKARKFVENMFVAVITPPSENACVILSAFSPSYIENGNLRLFSCCPPFCPHCVNTAISLYFVFTAV